jgi:hypothetical protein
VPRAHLHHVANRARSADGLKCELARGGRTVSVLLRQEGPAGGWAGGRLAWQTASKPNYLPLKQSLKRRSVASTLVNKTVK